MSEVKILDNSETVYRISDESGLVIACSHNSLVKNEKLRQVFLEQLIDAVKKGANRDIVLDILVRLKLEHSIQS